MLEQTEHIFFSKENRFRLCVKFLDLTSSLLSPLPVVGPEFKERRVDFLGQSSFFAASQESLLPFIADQKENIYARLNEKLRNPCRTNRQKNSPWKLLFQCRITLSACGYPDHSRSLYFSSLKYCNQSAGFLSPRTLCLQVHLL